MNPQVGVGEIAFQHQAISDDIDDIRDPRYHRSRRTFFQGRMIEKGTPPPKR